LNFLIKLFIKYILL